MGEQMPRTFTDSERRIAQAILCGHTGRKDITRATGYSLSWVARCIASMYAKTGATDRTQLALVLLGRLPLRPQGGYDGTTRSRMY